MEAKQKAPAEILPPEGAPTEERSAQRKGADVMRDAADKALRDNSTDIADGLVNSAKTGHMMAARLLYMIANDQVRMTAAEIKKARSLAAEWANERQWLSTTRKPLTEAANAGSESEN